jgi:hypothetical protein
MTRRTPPRAQVRETLFKMENTMSAVIYEGVSVPRDAVPQRERVGQRRHLLARFLDALRESRRQQARRVIKNHAAPLPNDPDSPV